MSARYAHNGAGNRHRASRSFRAPSLGIGALSVIAGLSGIVSHMMGMI